MYVKALRISFFGVVSLDVFIYYYYIPLFCANMLSYYTYGIPYAAGSSLIQLVEVVV